MKTIFNLSLILLLSVSCATSKKRLSDDGRKVQVLRSKPKGNCSVVDKVVGENDEGSVELARNHARNLVAKMDADSIYFDEEIGNGSVWRVHSTGYNCNGQ